MNPKEEGMRIMLSSFCSCGFGKRSKLSIEQLTIANCYRDDKDYTDEEATREVLKRKQKQPWKNSSFTPKFDFEFICKGYWNYLHMIVQFEDTVNVLNIL